MSVFLSILVFFGVVLASAFIRFLERNEIIKTFSGILVCLSLAVLFVRRLSGEYSGFDLFDSAAIAILLVNILSVFIHIRKNKMEKKTIPEIVGISQRIGYQKCNILIRDSTFGFLRPQIPENFKKILDFFPFPTDVGYFMYQDLFDAAISEGEGVLTEFIGWGNILEYERGLIPERHKLSCVIVTECSVSGCVGDAAFISSEYGWLCMKHSGLAVSVLSLEEFSNILSTRGIRIVPLEEFTPSLIEEKKQSLVWTLESAKEHAEKTVPIVLKIGSNPQNSNNF